MTLGNDLLALAVPRFACGHPRIPKNAYVTMTDRELYIRCRECHLKQAREYWARKRAEKR